MSQQVPDCKGVEGEYTWFHSGILPTVNGYQMYPQPDTGTTIATDADVGRTLYTWKKDYNTSVKYYATNSDIYEVGVGSRASGMSTSTYGPKFAAFGPTLFVTNGVNTT